jgi:hypothetical protein
LKTVERGRELFVVVGFRVRVPGWCILGIPSRFVGGGHGE